MNLFEIPIIGDGGLLMWPLLILGLVGFILFFERTLLLHRGQIKPQPFLEGIKNLIRKDRLIEALTVCEETPGSVAQLTKAALLNHDQDPLVLRSSIQAAALVEIPILERRVGALAAIAKIAPLIGLLGTIVGLIGAFGSLYQGGAYPHTGVLAAGIGEALLTTAAGLGIAVMAYLGHHFLSGRVRALVHDMEWAGNEMLQFIQLRRQGVAESDSESIADIEPIPAIDPAV